MLKRIFNIYSEKKIGFSNSILTFRNFLKFSKEFNILKSESHNLQLIYSKSIGNKQCDFNKFIELLLVLSSINSLKIEKESKIERFKFFIDNFLIMPYKVKFSEKSDIERIQVFYNHYDQFENPTLGLMISCDDLFQHVFLFLFFSLNLLYF